MVSIPLQQIFNEPVLSHAFAPYMVVQKLQRFVGSVAMNALSCGFLTRGGATLDKLYHKEGVVFGPAMVESYSIESRIAVYPRIVVSPKLLGFRPDLKSPRWQVDPLLRVIRIGDAVDPGFALPVAIAPRHHQQPAAQQRDGAGRQRHEALAVLGLHRSDLVPLVGAPADMDAGRLAVKHQILDRGAAHLAGPKAGEHDGAHPDLGKGEGCRILGADRFTSTRTSSFSGISTRSSPRFFCRTLTARAGFCATSPRRSISLKSMRTTVSMRAAIFGPSLASILSFSASTSGGVTLAASRSPKITFSPLARLISTGQI